MIESWIPSYWAYMAREDFDKAIPLKLNNFPDSFFKYRKLTELAIETIEENYIWLADISSLNDPFECSIQFDNDECLRTYYGSEKFRESFRVQTGHLLNESEIKKLKTAEKPFVQFQMICSNRSIPFKQSPEEQHAKIQSRWNEIVDETNINLRICSFSLNNSSLLLWSHYADEHKGLAIEYAFLEVDAIRTFLQPVLYRNNVHKIGLFEEYTTMQMIASSLVKSRDWEYEQEWRVTVFNQGENGFPRKLKVPDPKAIYLGTRFDVNEIALKEKLFALAGARNIPVFRMGKHPNEFKLIKV